MTALLDKLIVRVGTRAQSLYWNAVYGGYRRRYAVHEAFRFNGFGIQLYGDGSIELGENSYVGELSTIQVAPGCTVRIGPCCMVSHNVRIYTSTSVPDCDFIAGPVQTLNANVAIGAGVWIGANVFIGPGVSIGDDAVVGANSVVTRDVPAGEIWGGVPARLIRKKRR